MRIDLLLVSLCLVKTRSRAQRGCREGFVLLNGKKAKPSAEVRAGDRIDIKYPRKTLTIELLEVPQRRVSRRESGNFFRILGENETERAIDWDE